MLQVGVGVLSSSLCYFLLADINAVDKVSSHYEYMASHLLLES